MDSGLEKIGAILRQAREAQALSFEEAEEQTRIRAKFLQALEAGDVSILPSRAHARGFLRNYAQFLRLDVNMLVGEFSRLTGSAPASPAAYPARPAASPPPAPPVKGGDPAFAAPPAQASPDAEYVPPYLPPQPTSRSRSTFVTAERRTGPGIPLGVARSQQLSPSRPALRAPSFVSQIVSRLSTPVQPVVVEPQEPDTPLRRVLRSNWLVGGVLSFAMIGVIGWSIFQLSEVNGSDIAPADQQSAFLQQFAGSATFEPSQTFVPTATPTSGSGGPIIFDRVLISIKVVQRTWTRITVDGTVQFEDQATPGTVLQYEAAQEIIVLTGNAAGLEITYNGQELGTLGERGKVVERMFTVSGQITPTPTMTITPTPTSVPTPTAPAGQPAP